MFWGVLEGQTQLKPALGKYKLHADEPRSTELQNNSAKKNTKPPCCPVQKSKTTQSPKLDILEVSSVLLIGCISGYARGVKWSSRLY